MTAHIDIQNGADKAQQPRTSPTRIPQSAAAMPLTRLQRLMIGHGLLILFMALIAGMGLWICLVGGFEFIPGTVVSFPIPGTPDGWAKAHRGTPMNALMVFAVAMFLPHMGFKAETETRLGWIVTGTAWANTGFYFFSNFSQNRGLTFGSNHFGQGDLMSFLALAPAYLFGVASMVGLLWMARKAFEVD